MKINIKTEKLLNFTPHDLTTIGFNAYNHTKGYAKIKGGMKYCVKGTYTSLSFAKTENGEKTSVTLVSDSIGQLGEVLDSSYQRFLSNVDGYLFVTGGNNTDTCISLVWSGYKNEDFEEFQESHRLLPIATYFPDGMNGINDVYDELRKDKAIKRFGVVDLGTLNWTKEADGRFIVNNVLLNCKVNNGNSLINASIAKNYRQVRHLDFGSNIPNNSYVLYIVGSNLNLLRFRNDSYSDAAAFKTAMSGVYLVYELATPVETPISPELNLTYAVNDFGTEEFIFDLNEITGPVCCMIFYQDNLKDKLRNIKELTETELQEILDILA